MNFEKCVRMVAYGDNVLIVRDKARPLSCNIGNNSLFVRSFDKTGLKSIHVDIVVLVGDVPDDVASLATSRLICSRNPQVFRVADL